jgi:hypothetical protein
LWLALTIEVSPHYEFQPARKDYTNVYPLATLLSMKDVGLRIRIDRELRESFLEACMEQDKPAAQVLREFMREYVRQANDKASHENANTIKNSK